jgi:hypothetical protein
VLKTRYSKLTNLFQIQGIKKHADESVGINHLFSLLLYVTFVSRQGDFKAFNNLCYPELDIFAAHVARCASNILMYEYTTLKVPKCEIFDRSDFNDFYTIKSLREGDCGVKI